MDRVNSQTNFNQSKNTDILPTRASNTQQQKTDDRWTNDLENDFEDIFETKNSNEYVSKTC